VTQAQQEQLGKINQDFRLSDTQRYDAARTRRTLAQPRTEFLLSEAVSRRLAADVE
jgi:hypothetical protein